MTNPLIAEKSPTVMELEPGTYHWCACGRSSDQPFCDGSHKDTGIEPLAFEVQEKRSVALCRCKQTRTPPFCDGSHKALSA